MARLEITRMKVTVRSMRWRYLLLALAVGGFLYLANTNPERGDYTAWASEQFVQNSEVHESLTKAQEDNPEGLLGELATVGKNLTEKYVQPQIGLVIDNYTTQKDYTVFSMYKTEFTVGSTTYKYVTVGLADRFILLEAPQEEGKK